MRRFLSAGLVVVVCLLAAACDSGPAEVKASGYDQSCNVDEDCVLVRELSVDDSDCFMGCEGGAINTKAEEGYARDLDENAKKCDGMPGLRCAASTTAAVCLQGTCARVTKQ